MRINLNELRRIIIEALLNAYDVLGVPRNASDEEVKTAWKKLALQNHPDRGGSHGKMVDINNAKDRLLDKTQLFRYGPNFKGYENAAAPQQAATPVMKGCPLCGRNVAVRDGKYVNHYSTPGGPQKCPHSGNSDRQRPSAAPPPPRSGGSAGTWRPSRSRRGYEYNTATGEYRRAQQRSAPPPPGPQPGPQANQSAPSTHVYLTFIAGRSRKFWEIDRQNATLNVRYGRLGSAGKLWTRTYSSAAEAARVASRMVNSKLAKGYIRGSAAGRTPPGGNAGADAPPAGGQAAAGTGPQPTGRPTKDSYKVYGWRQGRRVVRVGGKLYGTGPGGRVMDPNNPAGGYQTRFNANDRARVTAQNGKLKVQKTDSDHSQTWDPIAQDVDIDEVRRTVDELIIEMFQRLAETPDLVE